MLVFENLLVVASVAMIRKNPKIRDEMVVNNLRISMIGCGVGFLTGFLGAGAVF